MRSQQDILAERRANALEAHRSTDPVAIENLEAQNAILDAELASHHDLCFCVDCLGAKGTPRERTHP